ncbi:hypothetical protein [Rhizobium skierniewicense]|uniref:hypothetical protein n=1 Tax=Rhizobium skierniewicense TaxID=984260 RepID=UPI0015744C95|nr:hypothetical protein [Rhizobium skierniewicense]NTF32304.1 hypothetical protein [Rhizobium skierniewicense]
MAGKIIPLSRKYEFPGIEPFDAVTLRSPTYREIFIDGIGEPREVHVVAGQPMVVTHYEAIDRHLMNICKSPSYDALAVLEAVDAIDVANAVCDFFLKREASPTLPT